MCSRMTQAMKTTDIVSTVAGDLHQEASEWDDTQTQSSVGNGGRSVKASAVK